MSDRIAARRIASIVAQYKQAISVPHEYVKYYINEDNPNEWWVLLYNFDGDNGEYKDGEYLVRIELPPKFPFKPPHFFFHTENGLFEPEKTVCISIGQFHSDKYRAVLGITGFIDELWNGLIGWKSIGSGISIITTSANEKRRLAAASKKANRDKHADIMAAIDRNFAEYSAKWDLTNVPTATRERLGLTADKNPAK